MKQLAEFPGAARARIRGVFCDIDDTLTTGGKLTAAAYAALEALQRAGLLVVPITGRPAGWCDQIARMWPVHAVVGENGDDWLAHGWDAIRSSGRGHALGRAPAVDAGEPRTGAEPVRVDVVHAVRVPAHAARRENRAG